MKTKNVIIPAGQSLSNPVELEGHKLIGLIVPANWVAANTTFSVSPVDGFTFYDLCDANGDEYTLSPEPGKVTGVGLSLTLDFADIAPIANMKSIRLRSGTSETPVVQTTEQIIGLLLKESA